jgi:hypothetical protein
MKLFDIIIYICLILFGVAIGWYLREPKIDSINLETQRTNKEEGQKPKKASRPKEYTVAPAPETPYQSVQNHTEEIPKTQKTLEKTCCFKAG